MNRFVFYIFLLANVFIAKAQENLVPNGSFEDLSDCPSGIQIEYAIGWFSPTDASPDLFNSCTDISLNYSVPLNTYGYQFAKEGSGYIGIVPFGGNYREYVGCKLNASLESGKIYEVSYYVNLAASSPIACNKFGVGFSHELIHENTTNLIIPQSTIENKIIVFDTTDWVNMFFYYEALGGENYIYIGNFSSDINTDTIVFNITSKDCYYFVDLVSLNELEFTNENCFTPNSDGINDVAFKNNSASQDFTVIIFNRWGTVVNNVNVNHGWDGTNQDGILVNEGVYFYQIFYEGKKRFKNGFIHLMR